MNNENESIKKETDSQRQIRHFDEEMLGRVLRFKHLEGFGGGGDGPDDILSEDSKIAKTKYKNICTLIPLDFDKQLDNYLGALGMSKRYFLSQCVRKGLAEVMDLCERYDMTEIHRINQELTAKQLQEYAEKQNQQESAGEI